MEEQQYIRLNRKDRVKDHIEFKFREDTALNIFGRINGEHSLSVAKKNSCWEADVLHQGESFFVVCADDVLSVVYFVDILVLESNIV